MYILGMSDGSLGAVLTGLIFLIGLVGGFLRVKQKADTADNMIEVDKKIDKGLKSVHKRIDSNDTDIKEMKDSISDHKTQLAVTDTKMDAILECVREIKEHLKPNN